MTYFVEEVLLSRQDAGINAGRTAVLCRFGRPGGGGASDPVGSWFRTAEDLVDRVTAAWGPRSHPRLAVCTGEDPLLQLDGACIGALHRVGFEVAVETGGAHYAPFGIDWTCVRPHPYSELVLNRGDEFRLAYPAPGADPTRYEHLDFQHFLLQPMEGPDHKRDAAEAARYCLDHPRWRLSVPLDHLLNPSG